MRLFFSTILLLSTPGLAAQSAFLNSSFDGDGIAAPEVGTTSAVLDAFVENDGSVILAGEIDNEGGVVRLLSSGALDPSFGAGGSVTIEFDGRTGFVSDVDSFGDGDLLVTGSASNTAQTGIGFGFVARLSPMGAYRSTFGTDGIVRVSERAGFSRPSLVDAEVLDDGRILVAASARDADLDQIILLALLQADGSFDTTFGTDGTAIVDAPVLVEDAEVLDDGRLILSGYLPTNASGTEADAVLVAITPTGALDTSFGVGGAARLDLGLAFDRFREMAIDSNGRIVVAGIANGGATSEAVVARYSASGVLDTTFGTDGVARIAGTNTRAADVEVISDDNLVVVGTEGGASILVARLTSTGEPDASFAPGGRAAFPLTDNVFGIAAALFPDGDILASGYTYTNGNRDESSMVALRVTTGPVASESGPETVNGLRLSLSGVHPSRRARVALLLEKSAPIYVSVYDIQGRHTATVFDGTLPAGEHIFDGPSGLTPGTYVVRALARDGRAAALPIVIVR